MFRVFRVSDLTKPRGELKTKWGQFISEPQRLAMEGGQRLHEALLKKYGGAHAEKTLAIFLHPLNAKLPYPITGIITGTPDRVIYNPKTNTLTIRDYQSISLKTKPVPRPENWTQVLLYAVMFYINYPKYLITSIKLELWQFYRHNSIKESIEKPIAKHLLTLTPEDIRTKALNWIKEQVGEDWNISGKGYVFI